MTPGEDSGLACLVGLCTLSNRALCYFTQRRGAAFARPGGDGGGSGHGEDVTAGGFLPRGGECFQGLDGGIDGGEQLTETRQAGVDVRGGRQRGFVAHGSNVWHDECQTKVVLTCGRFWERPRLWEAGGAAFVFRRHARRARAGVGAGVKPGGRASAAGRRFEPRGE